MTAPLLQVDNLQKYFPIHGGVLRRVVNNVKAVDGISFDINPGEVVGLVGESGSGKTTVGRTILRLEQATSGAVRFGGTDVMGLGTSQMRAYRKKMGVTVADLAAAGDLDGIEQG